MLINLILLLILVGEGGLKIHLPPVFLQLGKPLALATFWAEENASAGKTKGLLKYINVSHNKNLLSLSLIDNQGVIHMQQEETNIHLQKTCQEAISQL